MDEATNNNSGPSTTKMTGDRQTSPALIDTVSRLLFSSDYYRKVNKTTDIAGVVRYREYRFTINNYYK